MYTLTNMNLSRSFKNFEESRRHMPRNNPNAHRAALVHQIIHIIRPTGLAPGEFERRYHQWLRNRRARLNHAVNRMRTAASARRTRAMREQLGSVRVQTGSRSVNGLPLGVRNLIASMMRRP
jgi:hypothetical protein